MRTLTAMAVASGLLVMAGSAAAPAIADTPSPSAASTPALTPICMFNAKALAASKSVIAEVTVRQPARSFGPPSTKDTTLALPIRIDSVIKGQATKGPATLVVSDSVATGCAVDLVSHAKPKDQLLIVGSFKGTRFDATEVASIDHACEVKEALGQVCPATFEAMNPPKTQPWLKIAAPGLAAIIVSVLGLLLLRLRRR